MILHDAQPPAWFNWWMPGVGAAALLIVEALPVGRRRHTMTQGEDALASLSVGAAVLLAMAAWMQLDFPWYAIAWSTVAAAGAVIVRQLRIGGLPWAVTALSGATVILLISPGPARFAVSATPIWNELLLAYGLPTLLLAVSAWALYQRDDRTRRLLSDGHRLGAYALGTLLVMWLIRHSMHGQDMLQAPVGLIEFSSYGIAWLIMAAALLAAHRRWRHGTEKRAGLCLGMLALVSVVLGACLLRNPLWHETAVGEHLIFNWLLLIYGLPAALLAGLMPLLVGEDRRIWRAVFGAASLVLLFVLISLEVRQGFVGSNLSDHFVSQAEWYTYSLVWALFGVLLLVTGIALRHMGLRHGGLAVMLLTVAKVFLSDTSHLQDLYRVLSLLGLGVCLLGLGYLYHHFVFRPAQNKHATSDSASGSDQPSDEPGPSPQ